MPTKITWCDETWNPTVGCSKKSPGCLNCYAEKIAMRFHARYDDVVTDKNGWTGKVLVREQVMEQPLHWRKPRRVFVVSMGDLFHPGVPAPVQRKIFGVMLASPHHTFMLLTKRPSNMRAFINEYVRDIFDMGDRKRLPDQDKAVLPSHIWCGTTVVNQEEAEKRIPPLLAIKCAVRFVSVEPMLGPVNLSRYMGGSACTKWDPGIGWVICGGESGQRARPMNPRWVRSLRNQCVTSSIPFLMKQWGEWGNYFAESKGWPKAHGCHVFDDNMVVH